MNSLTAQILVDIINHEMAMPKNTVWVRDQNVKIPNDQGLYIIVGFVNGFPMANTAYMQTEIVNDLAEEHQICQVQVQENIQIDVLSRSNDALTRNWEVIAALQSFYSQQQQEANNFKIFRIPRAYVNASFAEGGSQLNRYSITVPCFVWYRKDSLISSQLGDYYDDFTQRVDDENTIGEPQGLIEFEITPSTPPPP